MSFPITPRVLQPPAPSLPLPSTNQAGGPGLPDGDGVRRQLRVGQPLLHDLPLPPGLCQDVQVRAGG